MLAYLPFLISANSFGVIAFLIFIGSSIILTIPVFATRGNSQMAWGGVVGFVLLIEAAVLITLLALVSNGNIWQ